MPEWYPLVVAAQALNVSVFELLNHEDSHYWINVGLSYHKAKEQLEHLKRRNNAR